MKSNKKQKVIVWWLAGRMVKCAFCIFDDLKLGFTSWNEPKFGEFHRTEATIIYYKYVHGKDNVYTDDTLANDLQTMKYYWLCIL